MLSVWSESSRLGVLKTIDADEELRGCIVGISKRDGEGGIAVTENLRLLLSQIKVGVEAERKGEGERGDVSVSEETRVDDEYESLRR